MFWVKITSGNAFPEMRLFGWFGKIYFPEIEIRWPKKKAFDHGNAFTLLFSLQSISGKCERERESAHARARGEDPVRDCELQLQSEIASSSSSPRLRSTARSRRRSRSREEGEIAIVIRRDHDLRSRSRCRSRSRRGRRTRNISGIDDFFFLGCGLCFLICVFLLLFQTPENIFRKIFWNTTKHREIFSFSGN